jgi:hypothetical protein
LNYFFFFYFKTIRLEREKWKKKRNSP